MRHSSARSAAIGLLAGTTVGILGPVALCRAQDSVSTTNAPPGDALSAYLTGASGNQVKDYVVDLARKQSSWGRGYLFGPLAKSSAATSSAYFNHLIGAQAVSNRFTGVQPFLRTTYQAWAAPGQGINSTRNTTPTDDGSGNYGVRNVNALRGQSFGVAFMEFAGGPNTAFGDTDDENNIVAMIAGFQPFAPGRLYVSRIVSVTNRSGSAISIQATASLGLGGVDEAGNVHLLADGQGYAGVPGALSQKQLWRVDATLRNRNVLNALSSTGMGDSGAGLSRRLVTTDTPQSTPSIVSRAVAGRPVMIGADFANSFVFEGTAGGLTGAASHLPAGAAGRGPISFTASVFAPLTIGGGNAGTCAMLSRGPSATRTRGISFWGVKTDGSVEAQRRVELPSGVTGSLVDPEDGYDAFAVWGSLGNHEFTNYGSQVCFRGGNGPVAMTVLPNGDLLAAALVAPTGGGGSSPQGMDNYLAVVRIDPAGAETWTIAAHTGNSAGSTGGLSKAILGDDGADGIAGTFDSGEGDGQIDTTPIGRIARYDEVFPGAASGPSMSSPAMDRLGNLYFIATAALRRSGPDRLTVVLLRANRDPASGGYRLEMLVEMGDVIAGVNSGRSYQVQFAGPADADSADSGAVWSGSIVQDFGAGVDPFSQAASGALSLGALVFRAKIVYDTDGNGLYVDPSMPGGASSTDQAYNAVMVLLPERLVADIDQDGFITGNDFDLFIQAFFQELVNPSTGYKTADVAAGGGGQYPDGFITGEDFDRFIELFFSGR
ncbi:MAG: hypothetical protein KIT68_03695 [Phycisphaeraceae bacterium]|nr:hypothetical protein [Phycisphaeraceae bacterium]